MAGDLLVRGGEVVDGTGAPRRRADVRVRDGRIAEVGADLASEGEEDFDAAGAVVTPGFIDTHAHTDPAGLLGPGPRSGAPARGHHDAGGQLQPVPVPGQRDHRAEIADLFAYIEDVPRHLFDDSVPWTWTDFAGYRDRSTPPAPAPIWLRWSATARCASLAMGAAAWSGWPPPTSGPPWSNCSRAPWPAGAWGLSASAARRRQARAVRCLPGRRRRRGRRPPRRDRSLRARAWSRIVPDLLGPVDAKEARSRTWPGGAVPAASR